MTRINGKERPAMPMLLLICLLAGAVLAQRFNVLVLIPAMAFVLPAATGAAYAGTLRQIIGAAVFALISLQVGYVAGAGIRQLMAAAGTSRLHAASSAAASRRIAS
jgi:hypothetical protein